MRFTLSCVVLLFFSIPPASADTIEDNLSAYTDDTAAGYLGPLSEAFGQNLNTGYFTTAEIPQDSFYFRLELNFMNAHFSNDDRTFAATPDPDFPSGETVVVPTVVGDGESVDLVADGAVFTFPGGLDLANMALAAPQLTIGSVHGTEGIIRWFGIDTNAEDIEKIELLGFGVRHSISQYFTNLPFELAGSLMYQTFKVGDDLIDGKALSIGVQGSKRFAVFEPFGSITLDRWSNDSTYIINEGTIDEDVRMLDFDTTSNLHLVAGTTANFGFLRLTGAINIADRFGYSAGLSFGN